MFKIVNLFKNENQLFYIEKLKGCEWPAGRYLAELILNDEFEKLCGPNAKVFMMIDENEIVSFCTYVFQDEIRDETFFPWIGFVYTYPKYRGNRYSEHVINHVCDMAKNDGYEKIYLSTNEIGLYEKYGFEYFKDMLDILGNNSRIYFKKI